MKIGTNTKEASILTDTKKNGFPATKKKICNMIGGHKGRDSIGSCRRAFWLTLSCVILVLVPDDDELGILGALLDVVCHDGNVLEVQRRIDLVHHVQRRRLLLYTIIGKAKRKTHAQKLKYKNAHPHTQGKKIIERRTRTQDHG